MRTATLLVNVLDGGAYGMLLFIVGAGLALVFGVMNVLNLSHGSLYLGGAYLAAACAGTTVTGWLIVAVAATAVGAGGGLLLAALLRPLATAGHLEQAVLTLGLAFTAGWVFTAMFGATPRSADPPGVLAGSISVLGHGYPTYRLLFIVVAALLAAALHIVLRHSHAGRMLRATIDDPSMAAVSGIRTGLIRTTALAVGCALACLGGVLGAPLIGPAPGVDTSVLMLSLIVVVLGGAGSITRTLLAALLIGQVQAFTATLPAIAPFLLFAVLLAALVLPGRSRQVRAS